MQFSKTVSLFALFFLATFGVVLAGPVDKRASVDASVFATLKTLQSSIASPLAHIAVVGKNPHASEAQVQPQVVSIQTALKTASKSLSTIKSSRDLVLVDKRQSETQIAALVAEIVTELATTLGSIANSTLIESLLPGLDADLNAVLSGLETLLAGVLNLVATLLVDVAALLQQLALGLTLGSLGL